MNKIHILRYVLESFVALGFLGPTGFVILDCLGMVDEKLGRLSATSFLIREIKGKTRWYGEKRSENADYEIRPTRFNACGPQCANRPIDHDCGGKPENNPQQGEDAADAERDL